MCVARTVIISGEKSPESLDVATELVFARKAGGISDSNGGGGDAWADKLRDWVVIRFQSQHSTGHGRAINMIWEKSGAQHRREAFGVRRLAAALPRRISSSPAVSRQPSRRAMSRLLRKAAFVSSPAAGFIRTR